MQHPNLAPDFRTLVPGAMRAKPNAKYNIMAPVPTTEGKQKAERETQTKEMALRRYKNKYHFGCIQNDLDALNMMMMMIRMMGYAIISICYSRPE